MGIRKAKAARLKIQILDHALKLVGKKSFDDLYVDELCAKVKISKVTFFKYFPQKEDVLLYYLRIWCLQRAVDFHEKKKEGLAGIHYLFDRMSDEFEARPGLMLSLVGYLSNLSRKLKPFPVKVEEKQLLFPSIADINTMEILSIDQMIEKFVLEAIFKKDITRSSATRDITNMLMTVLFGSLIMAHMSQQSPVKLFFRRNLEMVLKSLA
jgi:AcrR family transcriptional regulator